MPLSSFSSIVVADVFTDPAVANEILARLNGTFDTVSVTTTFGVFGATPAAQQAGGAATATGTYGANEEAMLQKAYNALRTFGFLS